MTTPHPRPAAGLGVVAGLAGLAGLAALGAVLGASGRTLPFPDLTEPLGLVTWAEEVGPATAAFTGVRLVGVTTVSWLTLVWLLGVAARLARLPRLRRVSDGVTPPVVRRLADVVAGAAVVAMSLTPAAPAGAATAPSTTATTAPAGPSATTTGAEGEPLVVLRDLGPTTGTDLPSASTTAPTTTTTTTATAEAPAEGPLEQRPQSAPTPAPSGGDGPSPTGPVPDGATGVWSIVPGDTLWHVAEHTASERLGRPASGEEIVAQLDRLVALNADRLAIPGDADLVFPGQEFLIP